MPRQSDPRRTCPMTTNVSAAQRDLILQAAAISVRTASSFIALATLAAAEQVVAAHDELDQP